MFRRTLLYAAPPNSSLRYDVATPAETIGSRAIIYLRRRDGVRPVEFRKFMKKGLIPALAGTGMLKELRTQSFTSSTVEKLSRQLMPLASAIPAYDVDAELTYLRQGHALPHYEE